MELTQKIDELLTIEQQELETVQSRNTLLEASTIFDKLKQLDDKLTTLQTTKADVKEAITTAMRNVYDTDGKDVFENEVIRIKYTVPTIRKTISADALKASYPDIYKEVLKETNVKDKITITPIKKKEEK